MIKIDPAKIMAEHDPHWTAPHGLKWEDHGCGDGPWPCLPYRLAETLADAERSTILRFLSEQSVRYKKHSAVALEEDYALASELFGFDVRGALEGADQ